jgi:ABC-type glutathione transport system ATPase component
VDEETIDLIRFDRFDEAEGVAQDIFEDGVSSMENTEIAKNPAVLLCDEPTGALDSKTGNVVLAALEKINRELGTTTILITHNAVIAAMADRVIKLADGRVVGIERPSQRLAAVDLKW